MAKLFTKKYIESLSARDKKYTVWDSVITGFGCLVMPSGRKTYIFRYRDLDKKQVVLTLGKHGLLTTELARNAAQQVVLKITNGIDPRQEKKKQEEDKKDSLLFKDFWKIFEEKYILKNHKPSTIKRDKSRIQKHILPFFGDKELTSITRKDILAFCDTMNHCPGNLNRTLPILKKAFKQAEIWELRGKHTLPFEGIEIKPSRRVERFLTLKEQNDVETFLSDSKWETSRSCHKVKALQLLLYTGCRSSEVRQLRWKEVNLEERYLYLQDEKGRSVKTGSRTVPLNKCALDVLKSIEPKGTNPYVFSKGSRTCIGNLTDFWIKVRKKIGLEDVRLHDLRHSFASFALKQGVDLYTVSKLLGHKNIATTTRYAHLELDHLKEATNKIFG